MHAMLLATALLFTIVIHPGDTLSQLASQYHTTVGELAHDNGIANPNRIYAGRKLSVPRQSNSTGSNIRHLSLDYTTPFPGCNVPVVWPRNVERWLVPSGCYGGVYFVGYGDCFGWVHHLLPQADFWHAVAGPTIGEVIHFPPGRDGASDEGHWAYIVSLHDGWALISEENMYWRGGGYNKMNYRFIPITADLLYYA